MSNAQENAAEIEARAFFSNTDWTGDKPAESAPAPAEQPANEVARVMFPSMVNKAEPTSEDLPEAVRELRANDPERQLYADAGYFRDELQPIDDSPEMKAATDAWRGVARDIGASPDQVRDLRDAFFTGLEQAYTNNALDERGMPDAATREQWATEAMSELQREFGAEAESALTDAKKLIARDPRLADFLQVTGLGSNPRWVATLAALARRQRMQGKLR